tara:strand:+ start:1116 stop:1631 length:516 start_codon:yes stop_codon:yes gene_type:complete
MELSDNTEIKEILEFAHSRRFSHSFWLNYISFFPHEMDWNIYLKISVDEKNENLIFKIKEHKFFITRKYIDRQVSTEWLKGFFNFRSMNANKEIDEFIQRRKLNEDIIKHNESLNLDDAPKENILANTGLASGTLDASLIDEGGPQDQNWDSGDWEEYMSGPDFEDGQPQW